MSYPVLPENPHHDLDAAAVIERIADAMSATLADEGAGMPADFVGKLRTEWDEGRGSLEPVKVIVRNRAKPVDETPSP